MRGTTKQVSLMKQAATIAEHHGMVQLAGLIDMATETMPRTRLSSWCLSVLGVTVCVHWPRGLLDFL